MNGRRGLVMRAGGITVLTVSLLVLAGHPALAQGPVDDPAWDIEILAWLRNTPPNWSIGLAFAIAGLVGTFIMLYFYAGDLLPSSAAKANIAKLQAYIDALTQEKSAVMKERAEAGRVRPFDATLSQHLNGLADDYEREIARLRTEIIQTRRSIWRTTAPLYVLIGIVLAVSLASRVTEAFAIGLAWTALVERFGLRNEAQAARENREEAIGELENAARMGQQFQVQNERLTEVVQALSEEVRSVVRQDGATRGKKAK